jgi:hypothetical protein
MTVTMNPGVVAVAIALASAGLAFWIADKYARRLAMKQIVFLSVVAVTLLRLAQMIGTPSSPPMVRFVHVLAVSAMMTFTFVVGVWAARSHIAARRGEPR